MCIRDRVSQIAALETGGEVEAALQEMRECEAEWHGQKAEMEASMALLQGQHDGAVTELERSRGEIDGLRSQKEQIEAQIEELMAAVDEDLSQQEALEAKLTESNEVHEREKQELEELLSLKEEELFAEVRVRQQTEEALAAITAEKEAVLLSLERLQEDDKARVGDRVALQQEIDELRQREEDWCDQTSKLQARLLHVQTQHDGAITELAVSYTHLRAHETPEHLVCRLLLEKKKTITIPNKRHNPYY
eukprot:TRINITY_DN17089_c0_g1_i3.p1 TRINITY_DN17089_c0_g1~~TRINITY_DN17089_c0_g1_i3.p1  ORF type:complete len:249 (-),score=96.48 TRINITY_DN17089_c0_g1_i3:4-750(-)